MKLMRQKQYNNELKEKIIKECQEIGNVALVARRYEISPNTIYTWMTKTRKRGTVVPLPRSEQQRLAELERRIETIGTENDRLKKIVAEKELELLILRELRDKPNPR
jgi:transposase-like protein